MTIILARLKTSIFISRTEKATESSSISSHHLLTIPHGSSIKSSENLITSKDCNSESTKRRSLQTTMVNTT